MAQIVESLPGISDILSSNPSSAKKKKLKTNEQILAHTGISSQKVLHYKIQLCSLMPFSSSAKLY
jgi:hypothetical protein